MAKAKSKKRHQRLNCARNSNRTHYIEGSEYNDENDDLNDEKQESLYQVPPELAPYALTRPSQIPTEIRKYWKRRTTLFSYFDGSSPTGMIPLLDEQSWFSVTPESIAARISQRCQSKIILDAFCGAGGNAIQFAFTCQHVLAIDIDPVKLLLARHNAEVYGVKDKITFLLGDWRDFVNDWIEARRQGAEAKISDKRWMGSEKWDIDVIFLSPPWGGINYRNPSSPTKSSQTIPTADNHLYDYYSLSRLEPTGGKDLYDLAAKITPNICMYLPRTVDLNEVTNLVSEKERIQRSTFLDVEEQWLNNRCKAVSCYFGNLIEQALDHAS